MAEILLMEDDVDQAKLLSVALTRAGHSVEIAYNGTEAWLNMQVQRFDLLITDIYVPRAKSVDKPSGGLSLIGKIRNGSPRSLEAKALSQIKIIAITGGLDLPLGHGPLELAKSFGADLCLRKPIEIELLVRSINKLLEA